MEMNGSKQHPIVPLTLSTRFKDLDLTLASYHTTLFLKEVSGKTTKKENVTAVCSSLYFTTSYVLFKYILISGPKARSYFRSTFKLRFSIIGEGGGLFFRTRTSSRKQESMY